MEDVDVDSTEKYNFGKPLDRAPRESNFKAET